jgi:hypothetical protein
MRNLLWCSRSRKEAENGNQTENSYRNRRVARYWGGGRASVPRSGLYLVAQRNYLFTYDGKQYGPLLNVEKAIVVYTRGFTFPVGYSYTALAIRSPSNLFGLWLLVDVRNLRGMIVDNAWNRGRQEVSLAKGKATLEQLVEWFLSEQLSWRRIATIGHRNALAFADFQWGLSHLDEKSAFRTGGRPFNYC